MAITLFNNVTVFNNGVIKLVLSSVTANNIVRQDNSITISGINISGTFSRTSGIGTLTLRVYFGIPDDTITTAPGLNPYCSIPQKSMSGPTREITFSDNAPDFSFTVDKYAASATIAIEGYFNGGGGRVTTTITFPRNHPLYGSVNGQSKAVKKLYGSVNGVSKEVKKLYGSVNGVSKRIY